jgi:hypothetical protein
MDFYFLDILIKKSHFNVILFYIGHFNKKNDLATHSPFLKKEKIKWLFFSFFYIRFKSPILHERNFLKKTKIGFGHPNKCLNVDYEGRHGGHQVI